MHRIALLILLTLVPLSALAQEPAAQPPVELEQPVVAEPVAPYDDKLLRLSEVLGSIHFLRTLCGANEGDRWRNVMGAIVEAEEPGPKRKARLIAHFNRGYRSFNTVYGSCTNSALLAANRYMKEGELLSSQITGRYGR